MKAFGDENEATPDSARPNRHPSSRTDVSSKRTVEPDCTSNLTPPPTFLFDSCFTNRVMNVLNRHPSSRTNVSSKRTVEPDSTSNLTPPPTFLFDSCFANRVMNVLNLQIMQLLMVHIPTTPLQQQFISKCTTNSTL